MKDAAAKKPATWRPPTRRMFVAMLGGAAAALAVRASAPVDPTDPTAPADDPPRAPWTGKTRWIGHC